MRSHALLGSALLAAFSNANPHNIRQFNSSSISSSLDPSSISVTTPSPIFITLSTSVSTETSISSTPSSISFTRPHTTFPRASSLNTSSISPTSSSTSLSSSSTGTTSRSRNTSISSSSSSLSASNSTSVVTTNASIPAPTECTGCVLEAYDPTTIWFKEEQSSTWTSVVVTETVLTLTITYMQGTAIDTVITTHETLNQTKTLVGPANQTIAYTTPVFTFMPAIGTTLTLEAGPTYVVYTEIYGGLDFDSRQTTDTVTSKALTTNVPEPSCDVDIFPFPLEDRQPPPERTSDWQYFIQTFTDSPPETPEGTPVPLPQALIEYLKLDPDVQNIFSGSDIATCTLRPTITRNPFISTIYATESPPLPTLGSGLATTDTYLSTTYESTSTHVTRQGCLRCDTSPAGVPLPTPEPSQKPNENPESRRPDNPESQGPGDRPNQTPDIPGIIASILNSPQFTENPQPRPSDREQSITIGDSVIPIHPAQPTGQQNNPNQQNPGVVIGSETLTAGQTTTINGVEVVVPTGGGGSTIIVGGSTIGVNPAPTGPPVLTVGDNTVTANPQGQFVVGTQTLKPGGPAITVDGSTLSLGPGGTIAVVNGVTQTLGNAPFVTGAPVLTVNGQTVSATVIGGSTVFVLGPDQTLTPGGVLTVDGTTFSMPADGSGSTVVVNGVTSTLNAPGLPVLTLNNQPITASVEGGTTAFILGPGQTLTPGGVITVSGTTYSMPESASGSVVVINGVTSTLGQAPITSAAALTIDGKTYSATVRDGTTEYVLGPGTTLKPGEAITVSGTTYSLDSKGTVLIINGKTSTIPNTPASNSATTTMSGSKSESTSGSSSSGSSSHSSSDSSSSSSSTTSEERAPGNFIASGIGISKTGGAVVVGGGGLDKWAEGMMVGMAGWVLMLL